MHIAFISSMRKPTALDTPGGAEVWATEFLLEAIKRNNTFDLYGIKDSINIPNKINLKIILEQGVDMARSDPFFTKSTQPQRELDVFTSQAYTKILLEIKEKEEMYDLIIDSATAPHFGLAWKYFSKPLLIIGHSPVDSRNISSYQYYLLPDKVFFVFPSHLQFQSSSWISESVKSIIPHGVNSEKLSFLPTSGERLLFLGRYDVDQPKGMEDAVDVANKVGRMLDIFTYVEPNSIEVFKNNILDKIQNNSLIELNQNKQLSKNEIFNKVKVLLFPSRYDEPFGLVLLESMATGTPIIGFARGALPDLIKDGETGFIVNPSDDDIRGDFIIKKTGIEGLCEAVERIYAMPEEEYRQMRKNCRVHVEQNFTIERMVDQYEKLFEKIVAK